MANRLKLEINDTSNFRFEHINKDIKDGKTISVMVIRLFIFGIVLNLEFTDIEKLNRFANIVNLAAKSFRNGGDKVSSVSSEDLAKDEIETPV